MQTDPVNSPANRRKTGSRNPLAETDQNVIPVDSHNVKYNTATKERPILSGQELSLTPRTILVAGNHSEQTYVLHHTGHAPGNQTKISPRLYSKSSYRQATTEILKSTSKAHNLFIATTSTSTAHLVLESSHIRQSKTHCTQSMKPHHVCENITNPIPSTETHCAMHNTQARMSWSQLSTNSQLQTNCATTCTQQHTEHKPCVLFVQQHAPTIHLEPAEQVEQHKTSPKMVSTIQLKPAERHKTSPKVSDPFVLCLADEQCLVYDKCLHPDNFNLVNMSGPGSNIRKCMHTTALKKGTDNSKANTGQTTNYQRTAIVVGMTVQNVDVYPAEFTHTAVTTHAIRLGTKKVKHWQCIPGLLMPQVLLEAMLHPPNSTWEVPSHFAVLGKATETAPEVSIQKIQHTPSHLMESGKTATTCGSRGLFVSQALLNATPGPSNFTWEPASHTTGLGGTGRPRRTPLEPPTALQHIVYRPRGTQLQVRETHINSTNSTNSQQQHHSNNWRPHHFSTEQHNSLVQDYFLQFS